MHFQIAEEHIHRRVNKNKTTINQFLCQSFLNFGFRNYLDSDQNSFLGKRKPSGKHSFLEGRVHILPEARNLGKGTKNKAWGGKKINTKTTQGQCFKKQENI